MPKLNLDHLHLPSSASDPDPDASVSAALPLFVAQPKINTNTNNNNNMSAFPPPAALSSYFSMGQWQELELQALIYRYILAGAAVPPELLYPIKKSLLHSSPYTYFLHHPLHQYQPAPLLQSGYWGRLAMDPEPGRCRRTDGKKWRCSKEVVGGHKYCERHMHRGRNRSRKPVEIPTTAAAVAVAGAGTPLTAASGVDHFDLSGRSPSVDLLNLSQSSSRSKLFGTHSEVSGDGRSDGHVLRHFFDDWPRTTEGDGSNGSPMNSSTVNLNSSSDISLKLSTGIGDEPGSRNGHGEGEQQAQVNWGSGWTSSHVGSMGGPLAEALRSSSTTSPTSVLHQLPRGSASDTSHVST